MKYIVMECHPGFAVLLDEDGRFLKAANLHYEIGDTVTDPVLMRDVRPKRRRGNPWAYAAGALAACLTLVVGLLLYQNYTTPVSSIALRINPELRMELNGSGRVVALEALNEDGAALLEGYDSRLRDHVTVAEELVDRAVDMGYLPEDGTVEFSIHAPDEETFTQYGTALRQGLTEHLADRLQITVEIHEGYELPEENAETPTPTPSPAPSGDEDGDDDDDGDDDEDDEDDDSDDDEDDEDD